MQAWHTFESQLEKNLPASMIASNFERIPRPSWDDLSSYQIIHGKKVEKDGYLLSVKCLIIGHKILWMVWWRQFIVEKIYLCAWIVVLLLVNLWKSGFFDNFWMQQREYLDICFQYSVKNTRDGFSWVYCNNSH